MYCLLTNWKYLHESNSFHAKDLSSRKFEVDLGLVVGMPRIHVQVFLLNRKLLLL
jgi:hypothetical protein